ncbi:MAG: pantoate--beta-alanine ligase [Verrucomicrobiota bacterium]
MQVIPSVKKMQLLALKWRRQGKKVGLVPTMGYLHEGHLSLVQRARKLVGKQGVVVLSLYVNPTQFAPHEDLAKYPRDLAGDTRQCRAAGVNVLFTPHDADMYPGKAEGRYSTYVVEENLSQFMEGESRPAHFRGVTTVVAKLFNLVLPDVAVFGAKDYQQAAILQRMTENLNFPVKIEVAHTRRENDGLAMSSRNKYLTPTQRPQAMCLWLTIQAAQKAVLTAARPLSADALRQTLRAEIETRPDARVDYIHFFDPETLQPAAQVRHGTHMAMAVFIGKTRLIDNALL